MRTENIGPNSPYKIVWWKVDLGGIYRIYSINILFKLYPGYGSNFHAGLLITDCIAYL